MSTTARSVSPAWVWRRNRDGPFAMSFKETPGFGCKIFSRELQVTIISVVGFPFILLWKHPMLEMSFTPNKDCHTCEGACFNTNNPNHLCPWIRSVRQEFGSVLMLVFFLIFRRTSEHHYVRFGAYVRFSVIRLNWECIYVHFCFYSKFVCKAISLLFHVRFSHSYFPSL